ncbi:class I SAM-dependent methyltransferase [Thiomicrorhabdus sp. Milos-T2]|uniref:class I SAM-dependent methyltransferase n=1 Tax=Thiomicrorhabdus sp. Milos-T2 TaxID=90814 RepID=UPI0004943606|nr:class I SAM-dependent methyltransferase [Thiomicrorhabdus sp. Milos-T2]
MPNTQGYEANASSYDAWFDENPALYQAEIDALKRLLPSGKGIEIGAGSGRFTLPLDIRTGLEPADAMREIAINRGLNMVKGVAETLPFEDNEFDFAVFVTSTCFLDQPERAYQEAARVISDQGAIVIAYLEKNSELGKLYEANKHNDPFFCDATFYGFNDISQFLKAAEFEIMESVQTVLPSSDKHAPTDILPGHDQGTFVVVKAQKLKI